MLFNLIWTNVLDGILSSTWGLIMKIEIDDTQLIDTIIEKVVES